MKEIINEPPLCPKHKKSIMVFKEGRFGPFWGCSKYPNCTETVNIKVPKERIRLKLSPLMDINNLFNKKGNELYNVFFRSETFNYLLEQHGSSETTEYQKTVIHRAITLISNKNVDDIYDSICSGIISFLNAKEKYFYAATFIFFLYQLNGKLGPEWTDGTWNLWLNPKLKSKLAYKEWHIKEAIELGKNNSPFFNQMNIEITDFEYKTQYGIADVVGRDVLANDTDVILELKKGNHRAGINQVLHYRDDFIRMKNNGVKCYVVGTGYPVQYLDDLMPDGNKEKIGLISYVLEDDQILFIPWKEAIRFN